jgi:hypothetical protein
MTLVTNFYCFSHSLITWGSGPLLCMARVLILGKLLVLITIICWIFYTLKQPTEIVIILVFGPSEIIICLLTIKFKIIDRNYDNDKGLMPKN